MKVYSTGLGKTALTAGFTSLEPKGEPGYFLTLKIESTKPVHWYITAHLDRGDIIATLKLLLRPSVIWAVIKALFRSPRPAAEAKAVEAKAAEAKVAGRSEQVG